VKHKFGKKPRLQLTAGCSKQTKNVNRENFKQFHKIRQLIGPWDGIKRDWVIGKHLAKTNQQFDWYDGESTKEKKKHKRVRPETTMKMTVRATTYFS
jgi:hypothetical protein